jgi:hypothetical protein
VQARHAACLWLLLPLLLLLLLLLWLFCYGRSCWCTILT